MYKTDFLNSIKGGAFKGKTDYGILPSLTIAQAILESGWGSSQLTKKANNLFGIKAFSDWTGRTISMATMEWCGNQMQIVEANFRAYDTYNDSIEDHNKLLATPRYSPMRDCINYRIACQRIYECGYATDIDYPQKLIDIIEEHKLYEYDSTEEIRGTVPASNDRIRKLQHLCNVLLIKDDEGLELEEDNILGRRTRSCIGKLPTLSLGARGTAVEFIQELIDTEVVDGEFGPETEECVKKFQRSSNITVDGIVGFETWTSFLKPL